MKKELLTNIIVIISIIAYLLAVFYLEPIIGESIKIVSGVLCIAIFMLGIVFYKKEEDKNKFYKKIIFLIIAVSVILRGMYITYTPVTERQHDVYTIEDEGHLGYIYTIYKTGNLPDTNSIQFYHPPLHHWISAQWLTLNEWLNLDFEHNIEGIQVLTAIYSSLIVLVTYEIMKKIKMKEIYKLLIVALIAVHPTFIILSGVINNDILMILLTFIIILYLLKWNEQANLKNTIILAVTTRIMCNDKSFRSNYCYSYFIRVYE